MVSPLKLRILRIGSLLLLLGGALGAFQLGLSLVGLLSISREFSSTLVGELRSPEVLQLAGRLSIAGLALVCAGPVSVRLRMLLGVSTLLWVAPAALGENWLVITVPFCAFALPQVMKSLAWELGLACAEIRWKRLQMFCASFVGLCVLAIGAVCASGGSKIGFWFVGLSGIFVSGWLLYLHALAGLFFGIQEIIEVEQRECSPARQFNSFR